MPNDLDFSTLSAKNVLDLAVLIEEEAKERYEEFNRQMKAHHTDEAARFFEHMAVNEQKHADKIADRRREMFGDERVEVDASMLFDVEAPEFEEARAFMSTRQALEVALRAETKAFEFYRDALAATDDAQLQDLFTWLRDEEVEHQRMVRSLMERTPEDGSFDPDDFVDEPTAQ